MKKNQLNSSISGFTLVEVLIAVGVLSVATLAFLPSFSTANKAKNLQQNSDSVKDAVSSARNKALTEVGNPSASGKYVYSGIKFTNGSSQYTLFRSNQATSTVCGSLSSSDVVVDGVVKFSNGVVAKLKTKTPSEDPTCFFFEYGSGNAFVTKGTGSVNICAN